MDEKRGASRVAVTPPTDNLETAREGQVLVSGVKGGHE